MIIEIKPPRRVKPLKQLGKRNRIIRIKKSEFLEWAPLWDLRLQRKSFDE